MKFRVIVADPPWALSDKLSMGKVKRGAAANYPVLDLKAIQNLDVASITEKDAVLALWVPSSLLQEGLDTMKAWGFRQTQTHIWVKTKKEMFFDIFKSMRQELSKSIDLKLWYLPREIFVPISNFLNSVDLNQILGFGMGRLFRQSHEICLIGVKGRVYQHLANKSQRSVHFGINLKHSAKPEILQDRLDLMFPTGNRLEMFSRRSRPGWTCVGNQCPDSPNEDIRDSLKRIAAL